MAARGRYDGLGLRTLLVGLAFLAGAGCGSIDQGDAQRAEENLTQRIGDALKTMDPKPPDPDPLVTEFLAKGTASGPWSLKDADPLVDRVNPAPGEKAPAPGDP